MMKRLGMAAVLWCAAPAALAQVSVTAAGDMQSEAGCPGDWDPACAATHLTLDAGDGVWQGVFTLLAGTYEFKMATDDNWAASWGRYAQAAGPGIPLPVDVGGPVKFYFDPVNHWGTSNRSSAIVVAAGSFQSELGCPGDWQPDCLRSWLQDADEDGTFTLETTAIPEGTYECLAAHNEGWSESYGNGGAQGGSNIPFTVVQAGATVRFSYVLATHVLSVTVVEPGSSSSSSLGGTSSSQESSSSTAAPSSSAAASSASSATSPPSSTPASSLAATSAPASASSVSSATSSIRSSSMASSGSGTSAAAGSSSLAAASSSADGSQDDATCACQGTRTGVSGAAWLLLWVGVWSAWRRNRGN
jgi:hypothetical protein